jgi:hypothetical protein
MRADTVFVNFYYCMLRHIYRFGTHDDGPRLLEAEQATTIF